MIDNGRCRFGGARIRLAKEVLSFDRNVDLDKIFVPGEPLSFGRQSSGGKEFHSTGAEYPERPVQDSSTGCDWRTVESDEFRRSGAASWLNSKEIGDI